MRRLDGDTVGPISYRRMYGDANPWVRWLLSANARLLKLAPSDFWNPPSGIVWGSDDQVEDRIKHVRQ